MKITYVASDDNAADPLTKALALPKLEEHMRTMGLDWGLDWH